MSEDRDDTDLPSTVQMAHTCFRRSKQHSSDWRSNARTWYDMVANKQWDEEDIATLSDQKRIPVVINRVQRTVNAILGTQISNRQETTYFPRELGDAVKSELLSGAAEWVRDGCEAEDEESDSFEDTTTCGMGWIDTRMDYDTDPEGMIVLERIDPLEMYWDPSARKRNLADTKWFIHMAEFDKEEFEARWPDAELDQAAGPFWEEAEDGAGATRDHVYPQDAYHHQQVQSSKKVGKIRVARIQWAERETVHRVGRRAERLDATKFDRIKDELKKRGIPHLKQSRLTWKQAFIAGGSLLEEGACPYEDGPTLRCITYKRDRNKNTWYGIVAAMMDPQRYGNKFLSLVMDILVKNSKGGVMMEKDAVDDPKEVEKKWAQPDGIVWTRPGAIAQNKIKEKPMATLPPGLDRLVAYFLDSVHEVTGINLELLGMANREQPGVLEHQRKQAGITMIAPLFDGLRRYRKEQGRVLLHFIQTYISDNRLIRIMQDGKKQYVPLVKQPETAKFDVICDESPTSPNMKAKVTATLMELLPIAMKAGIPVPPEVLDYTELPGALIDKWKAQIEQMKGANPQQLQEQMGQMQQEMQKLGEENKQLKDKREQAAMELQLKTQTAQQEFQLAKQKMQQEYELAQMKMQLERQKMEQQAQLDREKAETELTLQSQRNEQEMGLAQDKAASEYDIKRSGMVNQSLDQASDMEFTTGDGRKVQIVRDGEKTSAKIHEPKRTKKYSFIRDAAGDATEVHDDNGGRHVIKRDPKTGNIIGVEAA